MSEHSTRVASSAVNSTEVDDVKKCWNSSIGLTSSFPCRETRPVGSGARRRTRGTGPYVDRTAGTGAQRRGPGVALRSGSYRSGRASAGSRLRSARGHREMRAAGSAALMARPPRLPTGPGPRERSACERREREATPGQEGEGREEDDVHHHVGPLAAPEPGGGRAGHHQHEPARRQRREDRRETGQRGQHEPDRADDLEGADGCEVTWREIVGPVLTASTQDRKSVV